MQDKNGRLGQNCGCGWTQHPHPRIDDVSDLHSHIRDASEVSDVRRHRSNSDAYSARFRRARTDHCSQFPLSLPEGYGPPIDGIQDVDVIVRRGNDGESTLLIRGEAKNPIRGWLEDRPPSLPTPPFPHNTSIRPPRPPLTPNLDIKNPYPRELGIYNPNPAPPITKVLGPTEGPFCVLGDQTAPARFKSFAIDYWRAFAYSSLPLSVSFFFSPEFAFVPRKTIDGDGKWYSWHSVTASTQLLAAEAIPATMVASAVCTSCVGQTEWMGAWGFTYEEPKDFKVVDSVVIPEGEFAAIGYTRGWEKFLYEAIGAPELITQTWGGWVPTDLVKRMKPFDFFVQGTGGQHRFSVSYVPWLPNPFNDGRSWAEVFYNGNAPDGLGPPPPLPDPWDY